MHKVQRVEHIMGYRQQTGSSFGFLMENAHCVRFPLKYIEVRFPTTRAEFHNQIRSVVTLPHTGVVELTADRSITLASA